ncbi:MAG: MCP four helix bundle domain-containing protein [Candidatus Saccharibacteria bacterium]
MQWFNNLRIRTKLIIAFIIVAAIAGAMGWMGYNDLNKIGANDASLYEHNTLPLAQLGKITESYQRIRVNLRDMIIDRGSVDRQKYVSKINQLNSELDENMKLFKSSMVKSEIKAEFTNLEIALGEYRPVQDQIIQLALSNREDQALALLRGKGYQTAMAVDNSIEKLNTMKSEQAAEVAQENKTTSNSTSNLLMGMAIAAVILSLLLGLFLAWIISKPLIHLERAAEKLAEGDIDVHIKYASTDEVGNLAAAFTAMIENIRNQAGVAEKIAAGDVSVQVKLASDRDLMGMKLNEMANNIKALMQESQMLTKAAVEGRLDTRGNTDKFNGGWADIIQGVNETLDAVIGPLNVAAEYVDRISKGDIPPRITDNYNGDFNEIKNNLNNCIDGLGGLVECNNTLHRMAVNDHTKAVEGKYQGIYGSMAEATNEVRERLLNVTHQLNDIAIGNTSPLEGLKAIGRRSEEDKLLPAIINCMENIELLIKDTTMLSNAAVAGRLDTRADASKHHGEYQRIVQGINDTLDAVIGPLNVAAEYVDRISKGDIPPVITDEYNGDFNEIKNNLNVCINTINTLRSDVRSLCIAALQGHLLTRANADLHQGAFHLIVKGINDLLDATTGYLDKMPVPCFFIDTNFKINYINKTGADLLNRTPEALLGQHCYDLFKTSDCQNANCACAQAMQSGYPASHDTDAHPGDHDMDISYTGTPIKDNHGAVIGAFEVIVDQTTIMQARKAAQMVADEVMQTTMVLNGASNTLLDIATGMLENSQDMSNKTQVVSAAVEQISASIKGTASASTETSGNINVIASAVEEMSATIRNMASSAEETSVGVSQVNQVVEQISQGINNIASSANEVSSSVGSVATAVKEINLSLNEVSKNCERSITITRDASQQAQETNEIIEKLNDLSRQIGKIVNVINDIADQTNMLALNAAIEAAGAGEAGKGFAVVANEVKELAKQTAEATEEISQQIEAMQVNMSTAVKAVGTITNVIGEITDITGTIASAVTEQSATVGEISNSIVNAASRVDVISKEISDIATNTSNVARSSNEASKGVTDIARSAAELSKASEDVARNTEQASTRVGDVARSAQEISKGATEISSNVHEISTAAAATSAKAVDTSNSAKNLAEIGQKLQDLMKEFKV